MDRDAFGVDLDAVRQVARKFADQGQSLSYLVDDLLGAGGADSGDGELNDLIASRVGEIERALTGAGQALEADGRGLSCTASNYTSADAASQCGSWH